MPAAVASAVGCSRRGRNPVAEILSEYSPASGYPTPYSPRGLVTEVATILPSGPTRRISAESTGSPVPSSRIRPWNPWPASSAVPKTVTQQRTHSETHQDGLVAGVPLVVDFMMPPCRTRPRHEAGRATPAERGDPPTSPHPTLHPLDQMQQAGEGMPRAREGWPGGIAEFDVGRHREAPAGYTHPVGGFNALAIRSFPFRRHRVWRPALLHSSRIAFPLVGSSPVPWDSTASSDLAAVTTSAEFEAMLSPPMHRIFGDRVRVVSFPSCPVQDLPEPPNDSRFSPLPAILVCHRTDIVRPRIAARKHLENRGRFTPPGGGYRGRLCEAL